MKYAKKLIVWLLVLSMIITNIAFTNLDEGFKEKVDEAKIVEQLKEDLGEEKAEEILDASKIQKNEVDEIKEDDEVKEDKEEDETGEEDLPEEIEEPEKEEEESKTEEVEEEPEEDVEESIEETEEELEEKDDSLVDLDVENELEETEEKEEAVEEEETIDEIEEDTSNEATEESVTENSVEDDAIEEEKEIDLEEEKLEQENDNEENVSNETVDEETKEVETEQNVDNESNEETKTEESDVVDLEVPKDVNQEVQIANVKAPKVLNAYGDPSGIYWWLTDSNTVLHLSMNVPTVTPYYEDYSGDAPDSTGHKGDIQTIILEDEIIAPENSWGLFGNYDNLTNIINLDKLDTSNVTDMDGMFAYNPNLVSVDASSLDFSNMVAISEMFAGCTSLTSVNLTGWDISNLEYFSMIFTDCTSLERVYYLGELDTSPMVDCTGMFENCENINGNDITTYWDLGGDPGVDALRVAYIDPATGVPVHGYFTPPHNPIVTFNTMDGSSIDPVEVTYGETVSRPTVPAKDGYAIGNWYTEETYDNVYDFDAPVKGDITLYAKWEESIKWWLSDGDTVLHLSNAVPIGGVVFNEMFNSLTLTNAQQNAVVKIIIEDTIVAPRNCSNFFSGYLNLIEFQNLNKLDTSNVTHMEHMFSRCESLTSLNLTNFDTSKVENMQEMFYNCALLQSLDLSSFDTSSVTNMIYMFYGCTSLERIYYDRAFDTTSLVYSDDMFTNCSVINGNDITTYDDAHVDATYARSAYINGSGNTVHGYFTSPERTVTFNSMGGSSISPVTVHSGSVVARPADPVKDGYAIENWYKEDTCTNVYDFSTPVTADMTLYAKWEESIKWWLTDGDTILHLSNAVPAGGITFNEKYNSSALSNTQKNGVQKIKIEDAIEAPVNCNGFFGGYSNLAEFQGLNNLDTSNVTSMEMMFAACPQLISIDISNFDTSQVFNMKYMFMGCMGLESIDLGEMNTENVTMMNEMFHLCHNLISIDVSSFDTHNVEQMDRMFRECVALERIYYDGAFDTTSLISSDQMFFNCAVINGNDITVYDDIDPDPTATYARVAYIDASGNTVHGCFTPPLRTVTFNTMGGSTIDAVTVAKGNVVARPTNPTKSDYIFEDWYKEEACTNVYDFSTPVTTNITLFAKWAPAVCTVTFNTMGGSTIAPSTVNNGQKVTRPANPTKSGYTFVDWYKEEAYTNLYDFNTPVTENITLFGKWEQEPTQWTVTFNTNGGSTIAPVTVEDGQKVTRPSNPSRSGYTFVDWYKEANYTNKYNFDTAVTSNITIYAKWKKISDSTGGGGGGSDDNIVGPIKAKDMVQQKENNTYVTKITNFYVGNVNTVTLKFGWEKQEQGTWKMKFDEQNYYKASFVNVLDMPTTPYYLSTYYFNDTGLMQTGWIQNVDNSWYYMEPAKNGDEGRMIQGWREIGNKWYCFANNGKLLINTITPDGFKVNENGEWVG